MRYMRENKINTKNAESILFWHCWGITNFHLSLTTIDIMFYLYPVYTKIHLFLLSITYLIIFTLVTVPEFIGKTPKENIFFRIQYRLAFKPTYIYPLVIILLFLLILTTFIYSLLDCSLVKNSCTQWDKPLEYFKIMYLTLYTLNLFTFLYMTYYALIRILYYKHEDTHPRRVSNFVRFTFVMLIVTSCMSFFVTYV